MSVPLTVLLVLVGGLLRASLGRLPGWFFPAGLGVCLVILIGTVIWVQEGTEGGLEAIPALAAGINVVVAAAALIVGWMVWKVREMRKTREPDSVNAARLR
ncbi:hypothetical protein [Kineosporia sp. NBRC 101731]|uniref:hypothetical protein n=1 Tax=Kineosporia sp. NBRC 101731 TaxID=3032199 RepID=UPI002556E100|nr:hypothetical protein [Kineosporia sp. NBRC 101731]